MKRIPVLVVTVMLLAGCSGVPVSFLGNDEPRQVADLIAYGLRTATFDPEAQRRELKDAIQAYDANRGDYARVRLALLLALPGTSIADDVRAAALLEPLAGETPGKDPGALRQFAKLLHAQVGGRQREQRKAVQLKEQIDALRAIDRTLNERMQGRAR